MHNNTFAWKNLKDCLLNFQEEVFGECFTNKFEMHFPVKMEILIMYGLCHHWPGLRIVGLFIASTKHLFKYQLHHPFDKYKKKKKNFLTLPKLHMEPHQIDK